MERDGQFDTALLDAWRRRGDRAAMDELVRRHISFVYGAARRQLQDPDEAQDVTQAVFMLLMHKSPSLRCDAALAVWLHRTTRYACANARRLRTRRLRRTWRAGREMVEAREDAAIAGVDAADERAAMLPILDEAIERLGRDERRGVILCYFQQRTFGQIGAALGISEEAARKRVTRAIGRMRDFFASRGVLSGSTAAIAACMVAQASTASAAAPSALLASTLKLATISQLAGVGGAAIGGATVGGSAATGGTVGATAAAGGASLPIASFPIASAQIMKGVVHAMLISKLQLATAACAAIVLSGAITTTTIRHAMARQSATPIAQAVNVAAAASLSSTLSANLAAEPFTVTVGSGIEVQFLGVSNVPSEKGGWRALDGSPVEHPASPFDRAQLGMSDSSRQVLVRVSGKHSLRGSVRGGKLSTEYILDGGPEEAFWLFGVKPDQGRETVDLELSMSDGEWQTLAEAKHQPGRGDSAETPQGGIAFTHLMDSPRGGGSLIYIAHERTDQAWQVCAVDTNGALHPATNINGGEVGKINTLAAEFDLPTDQVMSVMIQTRPYNRKVIAKDVAIVEGKPSKAAVTVEEK